MALKDLFEVVKQNPSIAATGLFVTLLVGGFGGAIYVKANEQRLALMEQRLKQQEDISKKQKNVIEVIRSEFTELKQGILSLSKNLTNAKDVTDKFSTQRTNVADFSRQITSAITALESDTRKLEKSITQSEAITRAFSTLLSAAQTGGEFDTRDFVSALSGTPVSTGNISTVGLAVSMQDLKPGDLVFFNTTKKTFSHAGIYVGDSQFIRVPDTKGGVKVQNIQKSYWAQRFDGARRVVDPTNQQLVQNLSTLVAQQVSIDK